MTRSKEEFARIYGSEERVRTIKALPCAVPECMGGPCDNHHLKNGGLGRKGPWQSIVPLCFMHHEAYHRRAGSPARFAALYGVDLVALAADLAERYPPREET